MSSGFCAALASSLRPHFDLGKSRLETLCVLIIGIANGRTVNLSHLAAQFPGTAKHASNYRRLQRFFQHVRFDQGVIAHIIIRMLNLSRSKCLAFDRTNWKFGSKDINILVLAIVTRRFRVPILWTLLDHRGNSNTDQRIALMKRYLALFGAGSIELLLAGREFIGARWMDFLNKNNVPFAIRIRAFSFQKWIPVIRFENATKQRLIPREVILDSFDRLFASAGKARSTPWSG